MYFPNEPTLYLDVSQMLGNRLQTGIQRVVRHLARHGMETCDGFQRNCRLVQAVGGRFFRLRYEHIDHRQPHPLFRLAERRLGRQLLRQAIPLASRPVEPSPGDILLTLNATWDVPEWLEAVGQFGQTGYIASVMYDLTPRTHPEFHTPELCRRFDHWLAGLYERSHHWVGISRHVAGELRRYVASRQLELGAAHGPTVSHFRLGSDFEAARQVGSSADQGPKVRPTLATFMATPGPTLLIVGTVEPRKNHRCAIEACRELWSAGWKGRLLLIGRLGWKSDSFLQELASLSTDRFLWLADGSDDELQYAYRRAAALVFPSWEEGFGLPIVEALRQGTGVLASDHVVHREVSQGAAEFFSAHQPAELARLIQKHTVDHFAGLRRMAETFVPVRWEQSCRELIADVLVAAGRRYGRDRAPVARSLTERAA